MGQKVHPKGFRIGIYRGWDSKWFARKDYGKLLIEDLAIRKKIQSSLQSSDVARLEIEKTSENVKIIIHTSKPGMVIGRKGQEIGMLRQSVYDLLGGKKSVDIAVNEIQRPELEAVIVSRSIADQLERRASFKRVMKKAAAAVMRAGAKGIKVCCKGRLGGAEIARAEWLRLGSVPLHTLRSDIDYGLSEAKTTYGMIGVRVWICRGDFRLNK